MDPLNVLICHGTNERYEECCRSQMMRLHHFDLDQKKRNRFWKLNPIRTGPFVGAVFLRYVGVSFGYDLSYSHNDRHVRIRLQVQTKQAAGVAIVSPHGFLKQEY
jgi:DUF2075 family protein